MHKNREGLSMTRIRALILAVIGAPVMALAVTTGTASAATAQPFQATFVDIYSQCKPSFPVVFCGDGNVAGVGKATSTVTLESIGRPNPATGCQALTAVRKITLDDVVGSLTLTESGTKCPPSLAAAANAEGPYDLGPYTVSKTYTVTGASGVFAGATSSGTDINRSAGNSQVSVISGTLTTPA
jgi:hypothetical protein